MDRDWAAYYNAVGGKPPRETLLAALAAFDREPAPPWPRRAIDLGCGDGRDTVELLRRGWEVLAIDGEEEALRRLRARAGLPHPDRLRTRRARFEDIARGAASPDAPGLLWQGADLVNASFCLPFCPPADFPGLWASIVASLRPRGGRFAGQLFGERDDWHDRGLTCHTRAQAEALLAPFAIERFDEEETDGTTAKGTPKHWHIFHVVGRKR